MRLVSFSTSKLVRERALAMASACSDIDFNAAGILGVCRMPLDFSKREESQQSATDTLHTNLRRGSRKEGLCS